LKTALSKIDAAKVSISNLKSVLEENEKYLKTSSAALEKIVEEISEGFVLIIKY